MTVSTTTARQLQRVTDTGGMLSLLLIDHPIFNEPIRIVSDTRAHHLLGEDYTALPFYITLPNDTAKEVPRARLQMDNVGRDITAELERLPPGASLDATFKMVHRNTPDVVDYEFTAPLSSVKVSGPTVSASMGPDDLMRMPAVLLRFDQETAPGLFPD